MGSTTLNGGRIKAHNGSNCICLCYPHRLRGGVRGGVNAHPPLKAVLPPNWDNNWQRWQRHTVMTQNGGNLPCSRHPKTKIRNSRIAADRSRFPAAPLTTRRRFSCFPPSVVPQIRNFGGCSRASRPTHRRQYCEYGELTRHFRFEPEKQIILD